MTERELNVNLTRPKIWLAVVLNLILSPIGGWLYLNKGSLALRYLGMMLLLMATPFLLAHFELLPADPRKISKAIFLIISFVNLFHSYSVAKQMGEIQLKWYAHSWSIVILCIILPITTSVLFRNYCFEPFTFSSLSMLPTIQEGDYLVVSKLAYNSLHKPQLGDIVAFNHCNICESATFVKRVMALPNDNIQIEKDRTLINGIPLPRTLTQHNFNNDSIADSIVYNETLSNGKIISILEGNEAALDADYLKVLKALRASIPYEVPSKEYFVMGDYRTNSRDSRNGLGKIQENDILGKVVFVLWNANTFKFSFKQLD